MLDDLTALLGRLKARIEQHEALLKTNEALTRYALIDPLLRVLGWDTEDPALVVPEAQTGAGRGDYALRHQGKTVCIVEAKSLGGSLREDLTKYTAYSIGVGARRFMVTDGRRWELYDLRPGVLVDEMRVMEMDISGTSHEAALKALYLWRPNLAGSQLVPPPVASQTPPPMHSQPSPGGRRIAALNSLSPRLRDPHPASLHFPDGTTRSLDKWSAMLVELVQWLVNQGLLSPRNCPIRSDLAPRRYIVHTTPQHPSGKPFFAPKQVGTFYVETGWNSPGKANCARVILDAVGQDPAQFTVAFLEASPVSPSS